MPRKSLIALAKQAEQERQDYQENKEDIAFKLAKYKKEHPDKMRVKWRVLNRERRQRLKQQILTHYGGDKCACVRCGESRLACLSLDHINGGGSRERKKRGVYVLYKWLIDSSYPIGYQTLCMNCQFVKRWMDNECGWGRARVEVENC